MNAWTYIKIYCNYSFTNCYTYICTHTNMLYTKVMLSAMLYLLNQLFPHLSVGVLRSEYESISALFSSILHIHSEVKSIAKYVLSCVGIFLCNLEGSVWARPPTLKMLQVLTYSFTYSLACSLYQYVWILCYYVCMYVCMYWIYMLFMLKGSVGVFTGFST